MAQQRSDKNVKRITVRGVSLTVSVEKFDDVDLVMRLREIDRGTDPLAIFDFLEDLFGKEKTAQLIDAVRDPKTRKAKLSDLVIVLTEVFNAFPKF